MTTSPAFQSRVVWRFALVAVLLLFAAGFAFAQQDPTRLPPPAGGHGPGPGVMVVNGHDYSPPVPTFNITADHYSLTPGTRGITLLGHATIVGGYELDITADQITGDQKLERLDAIGHVVLHEFDTVIMADRLVLDAVRRTGVITNGVIYRPPYLIKAASLSIDGDDIEADDATITTSPPDRPMVYHIAVRKVVVHEPLRTLTLHDASIYAFHKRLITIRALTQPYQSRSATSLSKSIQQQFGYNSDDGPYVSLGTALPVLGERLDLTSIVAARGLRDTGATFTVTLLSPPPAPHAEKPVAQTVIDTLRQIAQPSGLPVPANDPLTFHNFLYPGPFAYVNAQPLSGPLVTTSIGAVYDDQLFGRITPNLMVTRLPEFNFDATAPLYRRPDLPTIEDPVGLREALARPDIVGQFMVQDGFYSELPSHAQGDRESVIGAVQSRPMLIGPNTLLRPLIDLTTNEYPGKQTSYHYTQFDFSVEHLYNKFTAIGLEYVKSFQVGKSPFIFDTLDSDNELDLLAQYGTNKMVLGGRMQYDFTTHQIFDYQVTIGPNLGSVIPVVGYDNRSDDISIGLKVSGFDY